MIDARSSGAGWRVRVAASDFVRTHDASGELNPDPIGHEKTISVAGFRISLHKGDILRVGGNERPASQVQAFTPLSSFPMVIVAAGGNQGMSWFEFTPRFDLVIPPSTWSGHYLATLVVVCISGPGS